MQGTTTEMKYHSPRPPFDQCSGEAYITVPGSVRSMREENQNQIQQSVDGRGSVTSQMMGSCLRLHPLQLMPTRAIAGSSVVLQAILQRGALPSSLPGLQSALRSATTEASENNNLHRGGPDPVLEGALHHLPTTAFL
jgi:hypothetical protein